MKTPTNNLATFHERRVERWSQLSPGERAIARATARATLAKLKERLPADLRELREMLADTADVVMKEVKQSGDRDKFINWLWMSWVENVEMEAVIKRGKKLSLIHTKIVSRNLRAYSETIRAAAENANKRFFKNLGKCLSGDISTEIDRQNCDIASIVCGNPSITAKDAVRELKKRGWDITEENFRVRKQRLRLNQFMRKRDVISQADRLRKT